MKEMREIVILLYGLEVDYFSSFKFLLGSFLRFWYIDICISSLEIITFTVT